MAKTFRMRVAYDGGGYAGFQRQSGQPSVQEAIETALWRLTSQRLPIRYAGRTDAGVHAEGQAIAFEMDEPWTANAALAGLNANLPPTIVVWESVEVEPGFDPRRRAISRLYRYQIEQRQWPSPFRRAYSWHVREPLDVSLMNEAAQALVGVRDLAAFAQKSGAAVESTTRRIDSVSVRKEKSEVRVEVQANAFLPHMVRNIVGTLVWIGSGRLSANSIATILASRDRRAAGPAAPGHGLVLVHVRFSDDPPAEEE